jgi:sec-independent protein translocase protein TatA
MLDDLRGWPLIILVALVVVLFGSKRLPDAARGLGRSLRVFKAETRGLRDDEAATTTGQQVTPPPVLPETQQVPVLPVAPSPAPVPTPAPQVQQSPEAGEH